MMGRIGTYPAIKPAPAPVVTRGMSTPWGKAQHARVLSPGIGEVSTAGHGGMKVSPALNKKIPAPLRRKGGWYEEDCDYAIVVLFLGEAMGKTPEAIEDARSVVRNYNPDGYEEHFGVKVTAEQSYKVREREAKAAHKGKLQVVAAWGSHVPGVPEGKVGVFATIDGERSPEAFAAGKWFLVDDAAHDAAKIGPLRLVGEGAEEVPPGPNGRDPFGYNHGF